jgi:hypothetical protein
MSSQRARTGVGVRSWCQELVSGANAFTHVSGQVTERFPHLAQVFQVLRFFAQTRLIEYDLWKQFESI